MIPILIILLVISLMSICMIYNAKKKLLIKYKTLQKISDEKLSQLKAACSTDENLMPLILDAVKAYATLGEICNVMRDVFGEYKQTVLL